MPRHDRFPGEGEVGPAMQALSCPMIVPFFVVFLTAVFAEFWFPRLVWPAVLAWNTAPTTGVSP
jgi:hypothetical protein